MQMITQVVSISSLPSKLFTIITAKLSGDFAYSLILREFKQINDWIRYWFKNEALFINESLQHLATVIKIVQDDVLPKNIPFNKDPLTLIIKDALVGSIDTDGSKQAKACMFGNIFPLIYDTAVTYWSLKISIKTDKVTTKNLNP